ncbi:MAG: PEP-CTERM sorting domain-containing protein, partial [Planctomycetota bacterium]
IDGSPPTTWSPTDFYWGSQTFDHDEFHLPDSSITPDESWGLRYPSDPDLGETVSSQLVDGSLSYNDSSATGYTGALTHGFGGLGHGSCSDIGVTMYDPGLEDPNNVNQIPPIDRAGRTLAFGFKLEETDGTHYGWVAIHHDFDRNRIRNVLGWAYQTTPGIGAALSWVGDSGGLPGDFDNDGDVDTNDIDLLCDNLGNSAFDLDGDGDADEDDFVYLIENLVELTDGSGRTGTQVGDFNLDGLINATDLAIMNPNFGLGSMLYQNGNANCDDLINATDLAILAANFGYVAPAGAVPEPMTMSLLALGAGGVLANRRRR